MVIIYHTGYSHTKMVVEYIQKGASRELERVALLSTAEAQDRF